MLRQTLALGTISILALSLLAVSMIICFTYDADAHALFWCVKGEEVEVVEAPKNEAGWVCTEWEHHNGTDQ